MAPTEENRSYLGGRSRETGRPWGATRSASSADPDASLPPFPERGPPGDWQNAYSPAMATAPPPSRVTGVRRRQTARERRDEAFTEEMLKPHAPADADLAEVLKQAKSSEPIQVVVLAADIRKSTILMREAVDLGEYADIISDFVDQARTQVQKSGGWFDKFTGDGFLAYWIIDFDTEDDPYIEAGKVALRFAAAAMQVFDRSTMPALRRNSRNLPRRVGLSIGIDAGGVRLGNVAGDVTVVGPAVVGAVRMVSAASEPGQTVANVFLGEHLERFPGEVSDLVERIERDYCKTKEYDEQEVYRIHFVADPFARTARPVRRPAARGGKTD